MTKAEQWLVNIARAFDIGAVLSSTHKPIAGGEEDYRAIQSDWEQVGRDLREALTYHEKRTVLRKL